MFIVWPSIRFLQAMLIGQKSCLPGGGAVLPYMVMVESLKIFSYESVQPIVKSFCRNVPLVTLFEIPSSHVNSSKNMAT